MISKVGGKAIIAQHIPQGANRDGHRLMLTYYEKCFDEIAQQYSTSIAAFLSGHLHRDMLRLYYQKDSVIPAAAVLISGAITPLDDSNPSFTYVEYNETGIMDWDKYYLNISSSSGSWNLEYTFSKAYPGYGGIINATAVKFIIDTLYVNESWLQQYRLFGVAEHTEGIFHDKNPCYDICLAQHIDHDGYKNCHKHKHC